MAGLSDGVSKLWILNTSRGGLNIDGYKDELQAIDHLVRRLLVRTQDPNAGQKIQRVVDDALKHLDEREDSDPDSERGS